MFSWFKTWFNTPVTNSSGIDMQIVTGETEMTARIQKLPTDKFALVARGEVIGTYSRKRDAIRGATRRGFTVKA